MKTIILFFVITFVCSIHSEAQYRLGWKKTFGGEGNDEALSVAVAANNSIVVASKTTTDTKGSWDTWLIKVNLAGNIMWEKRLGGDKEDVINSIVATEDNGFVMAGYTNSKGNGKYDAWIVRIDKNGSVLWDKTYGKTDWDIANDIIVTSENKIIVAGFSYRANNTNADLWTFALDGEGELEWEKYFGGDKNDKAYSLTELNDQSIVVAGYTASKGAGNKDFWILRLDKTGNELWSRVFGGKWDDNARSVLATSDGNIVVSGYTETNGGKDRKVNVLKINKEGIKQWEKKMERNSEVSFDICEASNQNLLSVGYTKSEGQGKKDMHIMLIDDYGNLMEEKTYGGENDDQANAMVKLKSGGFIVAGYTKSDNSVGSDMQLMRLDVAVGDMNPPIITWLSPLTYDKKDVKVKALISSNVKIALNDNEARSININGKEQKAGNIYEFEVNLERGQNIIHLTATNEAGTTIKDVEVYYIAPVKKPIIEMVYPKTNTTTRRKMLKVKTQIISLEEPVVSATKSSSDEEVKVLSLPSSNDTIFRYEIYVRLSDGKNNIGIKATNSAGEASTNFIILKK